MRFPAPVRKPAPEFLTRCPTYVLMLGGDPQVETTPEPKWSGEGLNSIVPMIGDVVAVPGVWPDGKPLGKVVVVGYLVEHGWLFLAAVPRRVYSGVHGALTFVAGIDLREPAAKARKARPSLARNVDYVDRFGDES